MIIVFVDFTTFDFVKFLINDRIMINMTIEK